MAEVKTQKVYKLDDDLMPIVNGHVPLPNFEPEDIKTVVSNIASGGHNLHPLWGYANINSDKKWAQFFLTPAGMGSVPHNLDGGGYVLAWNYREPMVGRFAICKHEKVDGPGANHSRGWHPGSCRLCGMDMTIDSGD